MSCFDDILYESLINVTISCHGIPFCSLHLTTFTMGSVNLRNTYCEFISGVLQYDYFMFSGHTYSFD